MFGESLCIYIYELFSFLTIDLIMIKIEHFYTPIDIMSVSSYRRHAVYYYYYCCCMIVKTCLKGLVSFNDIGRLGRVGIIL